MFLLYALAISLVILVTTYFNKYRTPGIWLSVALIGQAAALQLIFAGQTVHYQHYEIEKGISSFPKNIYIGIVFLEVILVLWKVVKNWPSLYRWNRMTFQLWQLILIGILFLLSSAALSRSYTTYITEVIFATLVQLVNLSVLLIAVLEIPKIELRRISVFINKIFSIKDNKQKSTPIDIFIIVCSLWVIGLTAFLSYFIYQRHPHVQDEVIYLYQARYFSEGLVTTPAPAAPDGFCIYLIPCRDSNWYSPFPPGWPAILGLGVASGVPWLVNPIIAGINIFLAYIFFQYLLPIRYARLAVFLLCASPWFIFMGMNFMSHTFMLTCALAVAVCAFKVIHTGKIFWAFLSGGFIGILSLIRNFDSLAIGVLVGSVFVFFLREKRFITLLAFMIGGILVGSLILPYNRVITGDPLTLPLSKYYVDYFGPKVYALGFGPDRGINWEIDPFPGYSPIEAVINVALNTFSVNIELFGWVSGSLFLVFLFLVWGFRFFKKEDYIMIAVIVMTIGMYSLFWFSGGPDFGARYWFLIIIPLVFLSVRAVQVIEGQVESSMGRVFGNRIIPLVMGLCFIVIVLYFPWRAVDKYYHYLGMRPDIRELVKDYNFGKSLVLIQGVSHPDYASAWIYNPIDYDADQPVFAFDRDPVVRSQVIDAYSNRPIWVVQGPTITGGAYRIIAGPISSADIDRILK